MTEQELIKIAKQKYPPGTIFSNVNIGYGCNNIEVTGNDFYTSYRSLFIKDSSTKNGSVYTVYCEDLNQWAEITKTVNKIYELW
jgi:hypothetical protein